MAQDVRGEGGAAGGFGFLLLAVLLVLQLLRPFVFGVGGELVLDDGVGLRVWTSPVVASSRGLSGTHARGTPADRAGADLRLIDRLAGRGGCVGRGDAQASAGSGNRGAHSSLPIVAETLKLAL
ncbi:hypothetical protein ACFYZB_37910 [Streptomyces sp. NPDC001852]|uniref:hypothetical protein n=1 Tax=Streptomyces sp. NPDC001852 TaxID=3364619 RepID=UPI003682F474